MLKIGQPAPAFTLPDADMELFSMDSLRGKKHAVLFFYPRDDAPSCTREAIDFSDHEDEFTRLDCVIIGISRDDCLRHAEFRDKHGLSVRLLADDDGKVCRQYGVCQMKENDGTRKLCVTSSTFIIDSRGILRHAFYDVKPHGHAVEVLQLVKQLEKPCKLQKIPS
ncbi:putative peroxiredoxin bcp [Sterolibacterium denitrificans]|uniref:thioredoxin-dependent peroxiredoxin n=1 Tax=Sterolibacterium denitrificans TaxID=157592 RepID=A0A7Z7MVE0_9PROT|nr:peroxiredoxin [Sterolibacterium denitrificans]SMB27103.1 putative peroxiredoxin bcp [Sterolibacterium denitrificans]